MKSDCLSIRELEKKSYEMRLKTAIMAEEYGGGCHYGGCFSIAEVLTALYFNILNIYPENPKHPERDRVVLSAGHKDAIYCVILAEKGFIPKEWLHTYNKLDSHLGMHPDMKKIPGCDMSTGSLGHGLSVAVGMALNGKLDKSDYKVFVILGDGELQEGLIWEAAMAASHYKLDNIIVFVDRNMLEFDGETEKIMALEPLKEKWQAFGWNVKEIDGHNIREILDAYESCMENKDKPNVIIANTIKGKGVSFMENDWKWHYGGMNSEHKEKAFKELEKKINEYSI